MPYSPWLFDNRIACSHLDRNGSGRPGGGRDFFFAPVQKYYPKAELIPCFKTEKRAKIAFNGPGDFSEYNTVKFVKFIYGPEGEPARHLAPSGTVVSC
jgi:hypothetical protein